MVETSLPNGMPALPRVLGTRDLVLLNIAAIVALRWLTTAAKVGPSSLMLWALGLIVFFIPVGLAVLELSSRLPGEGGLYLWTRAAFGDLHAFIAGRTYWVSNLVFFPSFLIFGAGVTVYLGGDRWLALAENPTYIATYALIVLWGATLLNIAGLDRAKWLQNVGGIATWTAAALLLIGGGVAWHQFGSATVLTRANVLPDLGTLATLSTFATIALAYQGLELGPILGGEIKDPRKRIPRAMLISGVAIVVIYMAGTAALLVALPVAQIDLIGGIPQAMSAVGERLGVSAFGPITAGLIALGNLGSIGAWMAGTARLTFVVGVHHYLPASLSGVHPKYGTPHVALLTQAVLTTIVMFGALSRSTIHEAFTILVDMTLILGFLPLLYMFASLPVLAWRAPEDARTHRSIPGGALARWLACGLGFCTTLLAIVTSVIPPDDSPNPRLFVIKVVGGCLLMIAVGLAFYWRGRARQRGS